MINYPVSRIVASVMASTNAEMIALVRSGCAGADLVELRIDALREPPDLERLRRHIDLPAILTCRRVEEGGSFQGSEQDRIDLLERGIALDFAYVDFELRGIDSRIETYSGTRILISFHDLGGMIERPEDLIEEAIERGAHGIKLAAHVDSFEQVVRLARAGEIARARGIEYSAVPLGPAGSAGRVLASRLGSSFMYTFARGGVIAGPGQLSMNELLYKFRFRSISDITMIYGILGSQVSMSRSPDMHNAFFREHALDAVYVSFQHECLGTFMEDAQSFGVRGVSVTNPFKEEVFKILYEQDAVSNDAIAIGAVNTMVMMDGQWKGFNTDVDGVKNPLRRVEGRRGRQVIVLGAGGAARAAVSALNELGMQTTVLSRRREQGAALARVLGCEAGILEDLGRLEFDVLINATPVGSYIQPGLVVEISALSMSGKIVFDMVTVPEETELIRKAKAAGATTISGLEMLSEQAVGQARLWTGIAGNVDTFRSAARRVRT